jgi:hypothetical protein
VITPIQGGSSFLSQHSLEAVFGLGKENEATIEVLWPGGVRNRLAKVKKSTSVVFPEIPCSFAGQWDDEDDFEECVDDALEELQAASVLSKKEAKDFAKSMRDAFREFND